MMLYNIFKNKSKLIVNHINNIIFVSILIVCLANVGFLDVRNMHN